MNIERSKDKNKIEAILFASPSPVSIERLKKISGMTKKEIEKSIELLEIDYESRSFTIVRVNRGFQLVTRIEYEDLVQEVRGKRVLKLSPQALETLAIVFKKGSITRAKIEELRGLDSSHVLSVLLDWNLIRVKGRDGIAYLYEVTPYFYEYFKIDRNAKSRGL